MTDITYRICNKCDRVHFPLTRKEVEQQATSFEQYITHAHEKDQAMFGFGPLSTNKRVFSFKEHVASSESCFACGNSHINFRDRNDTDNINMGQTIQGIIVE